ncbi:MAG: hypothetical protein AABW91_03660 [Nanoarchaeota archaeon]
MLNLEYKIGGLKINPNKLPFNGSDPYDASHHFVTRALDSYVEIYVAEAETHFQVVNIFNLNEMKDNIAGGGSFYLNENNELVLDDYSGDYDAISKKAAQSFAELILPEIEKLGVC